MMIKISSNSHEEIENFLYLILLGTIDSIISNSLKIDEAEKIIFNPHMLEYIKINLNDKPKLIELIGMGMELEDVEDLAPESLLLELETLKKKILLNFNINYTLKDKIQFNINLQE